MNALDLLVDFASLVSISSSVDIPSDLDNIGGHDALATQYIAPNPTSREDVTPHNSMYSRAHELPRDEWVDYNIASNARPSPAPQQQQGSSIASVFRASPNMAQYNGFTAQSQQIPQDFRPHLQPEPGLPSEFSCGGSPHCYCRYEPPNPAYHAFSCTIPAETSPWDANQWRHFPFHNAHPLSDISVPDGGLPCEYPCQDQMCQCRYFSSHSYRVADGYVPVVAKEPWDANELRCGERDAGRYEARASEGTGEEQGRIGQHGLV